MAYADKTCSRSGLLMRAPVAPDLSGLAQSWFGRCRMRVRLMYDRWRQRRELLALSQRDLADIGLTRCDALMEGEKPFWR